MTTPPPTLTVPLRRAARTILAIAPTLPTEAEIRPEIEDARNASERGYFLPDEDERIRSVYARYLRARAALHRNLRDLEPYVRGPRRVSPELYPQAFAIAFCNACMLMRSARYIVDNLAVSPIAINKLNEREDRLGIPYKSFTQLYRSLTSLRHIIIFHEGIRIGRTLQPEMDRLEQDPDLAPIIGMLRGEIPLIEPHLGYYIRHKALFRLYEFLRRSRSTFNQVTFAVFQVSGSLIAEVRNQWRRKRVAPRVQKRLASMLQPGDVIITRHDDALSNLFLPGFWPHGALYIGTEAQRAELGLDVPREQRGRCEDPICVLEARKDGVLFRPLNDTLAVDSCTILRPRFTDEERRAAVARALTHEGKLYDFEFDFTRADMLVCTEVIYRSFHGIGPLHFTLHVRAGRHCLSAEDILDLAVDTDAFEVIAVYGVKRNRLVRGEKATEALRRSYRKDTPATPAENAA